jgi:hypothetical protein
MEDQIVKIYLETIPENHTGEEMAITIHSKKSKYDHENLLVNMLTWLEGWNFKKPKKRGPKTKLPKPQQPKAFDPINFDTEIGKAQYQMLWRLVTANQDDMSRHDAELLDGLMTLVHTLTIQNPGTRTIQFSK